MNKKILALTLACLIITGTTIPAYATPDSAKLNETREKYAEIEERIIEIESKIYDLNGEMEPLQAKIDENTTEVDSINGVIENTEKNIENYKKEISELDAALGERVNAMYMSGNLEFTYLTFILESESTADFFSRMQAVGKIIGKDKEAVEQVAVKKKELDDHVDSLKEKKEELDTLTEEIQVTIDELEIKKEEQEVFIAEITEEMDKYDAEYLAVLERDVVQVQFDVINNSSSTSSQLMDAITQLRTVRDSQLKSPLVIAEVNAKIEEAKLAYDKKLKSESASSVGAPIVDANVQAIINEAYRHLNKPYVFGATGPDTFDCSGFTSYVYRKAAGIEITRTTYTQINQGVPVSQANLKPGDLVFPHGEHVGIYVGNGQMIHAPRTGDVIKVAPVFAFYTARRIIN